MNRAHGNAHRPSVESKAAEFHDPSILVRSLRLVFENLEQRINHYLNIKIHHCFLLLETLLSGYTDKRKITSCVSASKWHRGG